MLTRGSRLRPEPAQARDGAPSGAPFAFGSRSPACECNRGSVAGRRGREQSYRCALEDLARCPSFRAPHSPLRRVACAVVAYGPRMGRGAVCRPPGRRPGGQANGRRPDDVPGAADIGREGRVRLPVRERHRVRRDHDGDVPNARSQHTGDDGAWLPSTCRPRPKPTFEFPRLGRWERDRSRSRHPGVPAQWQGNHRGYCASSASTPFTFDSDERDGVTGKPCVARPWRPWGHAGRTSPYGPTGSPMPGPDNSSAGKTCRDQAHL